MCVAVAGAVRVAGAAAMPTFLVNGNLCVHMKILPCPSKSQTETKAYIHSIEKRDGVSSRQFSAVPALAANTQL